MVSRVIHAPACDGVSEAFCGKSDANAIAGFVVDYSKPKGQRKTWPKRITCTTCRRKLVQRVQYAAQLLRDGFEIAPLPEPRVRPPRIREADIRRRNVEMFGGEWATAYAGGEG